MKKQAKQCTSIHMRSTKSHAKYTALQGYSQVQLKQRQFERHPEAHT